MGLPAYGNKNKNKYLVNKMATKFYKKHNYKNGVPGV